MVSTAALLIARTRVRLAGALLLLVVAASLPTLAHADLYSASAAYKKGDYSHALTDFLALAELGQPQAQLDAAILYRNGQGAPQSDIHAYAWAVLAAENGNAEAKKLADEIRPRLAPGSERVAGWIMAPYTPEALNQRLMPVRRYPTREAALEDHKRQEQCRPVHLYKWVYPEDARRQGIEGDVFIAFSLMRDGTARLPRVILEVPAGEFGAPARESVLRDRFAPLPPGSSSMNCLLFYRFTLGTGESESDYPNLSDFVQNVFHHASAGDPNSQLMYGMLLVGLPQLGKFGDSGLPWFLRAAQSGVPLAQFEVGYSLLIGLGCVRDEAKALNWLRMAADQNEPNAEVTLATGAMKGSPQFGNIAQAKTWLEKAAAQGNRDGGLYLSALLAAAPEPTLRDPQRALELLQKVFHHVYIDPIGFEIRAAAQASQGHFGDAVESEKKAIRRAHSLRWDLSPLQARLASYQAGKPWYGNLLDF